MSLLYRTPVFISRKQPFVDWANGTDVEGPVLTPDIAGRRMVYLVAVPEDDTEPAALLDEWWPDIFEQELFGWTHDESSWPAGRTREMFDAWFVSEVGDAVIDLDPEGPLTEDELDDADLEVALTTCAWCEAEIDVEGGRTVGFALPDRSLLSHREGRVWTIAVGQKRIVTGIVSGAESDAAVAGSDVVFRACSRRCERLLQKLMPKAIRDASKLLAVVPPSGRG